MKGHRYRKPTQSATTAIAVSRETHAYLRKSTLPGEATDDALRRLLGLPKRELDRVLRLGVTSVDDDVQ